MFAAIIMISIISLQVFWSLRASDSLEQQFSHNVKMSLSNAVESVCQVNGTDVPVQNPVEQVSDAYFIVRTNQPIQLQSLKSILTAEFNNRSIEEDFEFGVYDCQGDQMIYGDFVSMTDVKQSISPSKLPVLEDYDYYFGVYFPDHEEGFWWAQPLLQWTTIITGFIFLFFVYAIFVLFRQKRLSAVQTDFINNIMHELKTPVSSLKIAAEVLAGEDITSQPDRFGRYSLLIKEETERLEAHVQQLLRSAEVDEQKEVAWENVELRNVLDKINARMISKLQGKTLHIDCSPGLMLFSDRYYLETVFTNLIENGVKYGGQNIYISCAEDKGALVIVVYDDGCGIPVSESKKIFQRFYRISQGDQYDIGGFGLGLYVVKKLVKKLKGKIDLVDPSKAKFSLTFRAV